MGYMILSLLAELAGAIGFTVCQISIFKNVNAFLHLLVIETYSFFLVSSADFFMALWKIYPVFAIPYTIAG
jgi:hypothetical protein